MVFFIFAAAVLLSSFYQSAVSQSIRNITISSDMTAQSISDTLNGLPNDLAVLAYLVPVGGSFNASQLSALVQARSEQEQIIVSYSIEGATSRRAQFVCTDNDAVPSFSDYHPRLSISDVTLCGCRLVFRGSGRPSFFNSEFRDTGPPRGNQSLVGSSFVLQYVGGQGGPVIEGCTFTSNTITPLSIDGCCQGFQLTKSHFINNTLHLQQGACDVINVSSSSVSAGVSLIFGKVLPTPANPELRASIDGCSFVGNTVRACLQCAAAANGSALQVIAKPTQDLPENVTFNTSVLVSDTTFDSNSVKSLDDSSPMSTGYTGGAVAVTFLSVSNFDISLVDSNFTHNLASRGGGVSFMFSGTSSGNNVNISAVGGRCQFINNTATSHVGMAFHSDDDILGLGGGVNVEFRQFATENSVRIGGYFYGNSAAEGGGAHAGFYESESGNTLTIDNSEFQANRAITGAAIHLWSDRVYETVGQRRSGGDIVLHNSQFVDNVAYFRGAVAVTSLEVRKTGTLTFMGNTNSAFFMRQSLAHVDGVINYYANSGEVGAGLFMATSQIRFHLNAVANFTGNTALTVGGAVFAYVELRSIQLAAALENSRCFVVFNNLTIPPTHWKGLLSVYFDRNVAGQAGSAIYAPDLTVCQGLFLPDNIRESLQWATFTNNMIVPALARSSIYSGVPGVSTQFLAYPVANFYEEPTLADEKLQYPGNDDLARLTQYNVFEVATDIYKMQFIEDDDQKLYEYNCSRLLKEKGVVHFHVPTGIEQRLRLVACDQVDQVTPSALLYIYLRSDFIPSNGQSQSLRAGSTDVAIVRGREVRLINNTLSPIVLAAANKTSGLQAVLHATVIGATRLVRTTATITIADCWPGYKWDNVVDNITGETGTLYECACDRSVVDACDGASVTLKRGVWAVVYDNKLERHTCPPNYCRCNGLTKNDCDFNTQNQSESLKQCNSYRYGKLCGQCPHGHLPSLEIYHGQCIDPQSCPLPKGVGISLAFVGTFLGVLLVLWLDLPLANDLKVFLFFGAMVRMLFFPEDEFIVKVNTNDYTSAYGALRVLLDLADVSWCTDACLFRWVNDASDTIASSFLVPGFAMLLLILLQFMSNVDLAGCFTRCTGQEPCAVCSHRFLKLGSTWNGTWLIVYYCFHHMLETCVLLVQCTTVAGEFVFYWDGLPCFRGNHLAAYSAAWVGFALLLLLFIFVVCLTRDVRRGCFACCPNLVDQAGAVLKIGLRKGKESWWAWDLFRRGMIVTLYAPIAYNYTHWYKQIAILAVLIIILAAHVWHMPYSDLTKERESQQAPSPAVFTVLSFLQKGKRCNYLEILILFNMVLIAALSSGAALSDDINTSEVRKWLLGVLVTIPIVIGYFIFIHKVLMCLKEKCWGSTRPLCSGCGPCSKAPEGQPLTTKGHKVVNTSASSDETSRLMPRRELVMDANSYDSLMESSSTA